LEDGDEALRQFVGEQRLGQFAEVLLHHVGHVARLMVLELDVFRVGLGQLLQTLYAGLDAGLPEQAHVVEGVVLQPPEGGLDERRQRRAVFLDVRDQRDAENSLI